MRPRRMVEKKSGFTGGLKHYHRASKSNDKNWEAWVNGASGQGVKSRDWQQILIVTTAGLALLGLIIGLIIELG